MNKQLILVISGLFLLNGCDKKDSTKVKFSNRPPTVINITYVLNPEDNTADATAGNINPNPQGATTDATTTGNINPNPQGATTDATTTGNTNLNSQGATTDVTTTGNTNLNSQGATTDVTTTGNTNLNSQGATTDVTTTGNTNLNSQGAVDNIKVVLPPKKHLSPEEQEELDWKLIQASEHGPIETVNFYLEKGANPNAVYQYTDIVIFTPLLKATQGGHTDIVNRLADAGANIHYRTPDYPYNISLTMHATIGGHYDTAKALVQRGDDPQLKNPATGDTVLHIAAKKGTKGHSDLTDFFLQKKVSPNSKNNQGDTPLHNAASYGRFETALKLIEGKAYPDIKNKKGIAPLFLASDGGYFKIVTLLLENQADPNATTPVDAILVGKQNSLMVAVKESSDKNDNLGVDYYKTIQQLLLYDANPNAKDSNGQTTLHLAEFKDPEIIKLLLDNGADPTITDNNNQTPRISY